MRKVFISYRRHDLPTGFAGQIHQYLEAKLGSGSVFRDLDSLPPGIEFLPRIKAALRECDLALVLVGPSWNPPGEDRQPRLSDPGDVLRMEVAEALRRKHVHVLPILFGVKRLSPPEELPDDLRRLCGLNHVSWHLDDPETTELERLWRKILSIDRSRGPLDPPTEETAVVVPPTPHPEPSVSIGPGATVGGCVLEDELAADERAVVYRGHQLALERRVAVKVMSACAAAAPSARHRFAHAAKLMAGLGNEHIVPVYDVGDVSERSYVVMHLVIGQSLAEILAGTGTLSAPRALDVIGALGSALDAAHAAGLAHGALSPQKVLVEQDTTRVFLSAFEWMDPRAGEPRQRDAVAADIEGLVRLLEALLAGQGKRIADAGPDVPAELRELVVKLLVPGALAQFERAGAVAAAARRAFDRTAVATEQLQTPNELIGVPLSDSLSAQVLELAQDAIPQILDPAARLDVENLRRRLKDPIHLALVAHASAGRSTLANSLLGCRVAPTDGRFPNAIGWYRFGRSQRVEIVLRGGDRVAAELTDNGIQTRGLGCRPEEVAAIDARLPLEQLRSLTVVDLPAAELHGGSEDLEDVGGCTSADYVSALRRADAVVLAVRSGPALDGAEVAIELADHVVALAGESALTGLRAVAVIAAAASDTSSSDARDAARRAADQLGRRVAAVLPTVPLLAQTATTGAVTDRLMFALNAIAEARPSDRARIAAALDAGRSLAGIVSLTPEELDQVERTLGAYGVGQALELAAAGPLTIASLTQRLRELSGIDELLREIAGIELRADALKASQALQALEKLSWKPELGFLGDRIEELRLAGQGMELVALVEAFSHCVNGRIALRGERLGELQKLLTGRSPADRLLGRRATADELCSAALERLHSWKAFESGAVSSFEEKHVAAAVVRHYQALLDDPVLTSKRGSPLWART